MSIPSDVLRALRSAIENRQSELASQTGREALAAGIDPLVVMEEGLMDGAGALGEAFECGRVFLPELMLGGRALKSAMAVLTPVVQVRRESSPAGAPAPIVVATVLTDIHDIGKNVVAAMLSASGFEVIDLGVDVPPKTILERAVDVDARLIGISALLTTSLPYMRDLIDLLISKGVRERFKVIVGGAAVSAEYAARIGSGGTAPNAAQAALLAKRLLAPHPDALGVV